MDMLKRFTPQLVLLALICLIAAFGYVKTEIIGTVTVADTTKTIIIDAGHAALKNTID